MKVLMRRKSYTSWHRTLQTRLQHLKTAMASVRQQAWDSRLDWEQPWDDYFGSGIWGLIDSFPIYVRRPKARAWQRALYQGKYKRHIAKMQVCLFVVALLFVQSASRSFFCILIAQVICASNGMPLFWSGPHAGVISDIRCYRMYGPVLAADEALLGDKAYYGSEELIPPYKKPRGGELTADQRDYNLIHGCTRGSACLVCITSHACVPRSWYRAGVEHCYSQCKKFGMIGQIYRGQVSRHPQLLQNAVDVIMCTVIMQIARSPLRVHHDLLGNEGLALARKKAAENAAAERKAPRDYHNALPLGNHRVDLQGVDGKMVGPGAEPDPIALGVDTGNRASDFAKGERVLCWWWGLWWYCRVRFVSTFANELTVRWEWSSNETKHFRPDLVHHV